MPVNSAQLFEDLVTTLQAHADPQQAAAAKADLKSDLQFIGVPVPQLGEREFFIRKAIGWVLRDVSKRDPQWVQGFIDQHRAQMAGLTLREASKYLTAPKS